MTKACFPVLLLIASLSWTGCSDDTNTDPQQDGSVIVDDSSQLPLDSAPPPADQGVTVDPCECSMDKVCDTNGDCIDIPVPAAGEAFAEFILLRQHRPLGDPTSVLDNLGKGEATIYNQEPLPSDTRTAYTTVEGESCWMEFGTIWPWVPTEGSWWPEGPGLSAGDLTFDVTGGGGPIVLEVVDTGYPEWPGYGYMHKDVPPPANASMPDFFAPDIYLPFGAPFQVTTAGGDQVAPQTFYGGAIPQDFSITEPLESVAGHTAPQDQPLKITWAPPQPGAMVDIFLTQSLGMGSVVLISCQVADDGEANIPTDVLAEFMPLEMGIQLRRNMIRYHRAQTADGSVLHLNLVGRHARFTHVELQ